MNTPSRVVAYVLISMLGVLSGCAGKRPFLMVQTCLGDEQNVVLFTSAMRAIAQSQHMTFIDGSTETQGQLARLKANPEYRLINVGIEGKDGAGLMAGNLGLSQYEVAIGFSEGSNPAGARQFADLVVGTLKQRWQVHVVPTGQGAFPMKSCALRASGNKE